MAGAILRASFSTRSRILFFSVSIALSSTARSVSLQRSASTSLCTSDSLASISSTPRSVVNGLRLWRM
uniref:Putative secreted protein n=1 Tax=Anopheles triannulatus TaxID=58253 RepID=A0A2M4B7W8_9DIPT